MSEIGSIIGGVFGMEDGAVCDAPSPPFLNQPCLHLANGRSGIWVLVQRLRPPQVWLPSYLCAAVVGAVEQSKCGLCLYEIDDNLMIRDEHWIAKVAAGDLVLFIDYFGFPADRHCVDLVKQRGAWVLEDACQALLSQPVAGSADFILYSARKFLGVPDGGILQIPSGCGMGELALERPPADWWLKALAATLRRRDFDQGVPCRDWFGLFQEAEATAPLGRYAMSELSRVLLAHGVDYATISRRRRENYAFLLDRLGGCALFPRLPGEVVPLGFPVRIQHRDAVRNALFAENIFPPVHWPLDGVVPAEYDASHRLAREIMTLPCDQRYDVRDMARMANIVANCL